MSVVEPGHDVPPFIGTGLLQDLVLILTFAKEQLHEVHVPQLERKPKIQPPKMTSHYTTTSP